MGYFDTFPRRKAHPLPPSPDGYLADVFSAKSASDGGVIRRKVADVDRIAGRDTFLSYCRAHGFRVIENNGHFVVLCNRAPVLLHD